MSDVIRVVRDEIERGDEVLVMRRGPVPRPARVTEVLRAAVRVSYLDKGGTHKEEVVRFNEIELQRFEAKPRRRSIVRAEVVSSPPPPPEPPAPEPPPAPGPSGEVDAWFEMGKDIADKLRAEIEGMEREEADLRLDAHALIQAADAVKARRAQHARRLELLRAMVSP